MCDRGADKFALQWREGTLGIELDPYPADWDRHGRSAGPRRNQEMAETSDCLLAFWDGKSKGTRNMIQLALDYGLEVHVYRQK